MGENCSWSMALFVDVCPKRTLNPLKLSDAWIRRAWTLPRDHSTFRGLSETVLRHNSTKQHTHASSVLPRPWGECPGNSTLIIYSPQASTKLSPFVQNLWASRCVSRRHVYFHAAKPCCCVACSNSHRNGLLPYAIAATGLKPYSRTERRPLSLLLKRTLFSIVVLLQADVERPRQLQQWERKKTCAPRTESYILLFTPVGRYETHRILPIQSPPRDCT